MNLYSDRLKIPCAVSSSQNRPRRSAAMLPGDFNILDGVVKSSISCVITAMRCQGTPNAQHTLCMPPLGRHHYASESRMLACLYIELLCLATFSGTMAFFQVHHPCTDAFSLDLATTFLL